MSARDLPRQLALLALSEVLWRRAQWHSWRLSRSRASAAQHRAALEVVAARALAVGKLP